MYEIQATGWFLQINAKCIGVLEFDNHMYIFDERGGGAYNEHTLVALDEQFKADWADSLLA